MGWLVLDDEEQLVEAVGLLTDADFVGELGSRRLRELAWRGYGRLSSLDVFGSVVECARVILESETAPQAELCAYRRVGANLGDNMGDNVLDRRGLEYPQAQLGSVLAAGEHKSLVLDVLAGDEEPLGLPGRVIGVKVVEQGVESDLLPFGEVVPWSKPGRAGFASRTGGASPGARCRVALDAESAEEVVVAELEEFQEGRFSAQFFGLWNCTHVSSCSVCNFAASHATYAVSSRSFLLCLQFCTFSSQFCRCKLSLKSCYYFLGRSHAALSRIEG